MHTCAFWTVSRYSMQHIWRSLLRRICAPLPEQVPLRPLYLGREHLLRRAWVAQQLVLLPYSLRTRWNSDKTHWRKFKGLTIDWLVLQGSRRSPFGGSFLWQTEHEKKTACIREAIGNSKGVRSGTFGLYRCQICFPSQVHPTCLCLQADGCFHPKTKALYKRWVSGKVVVLCRQHRWLESNKYYTQLCDHDLP